MDGYGYALSLPLCGAIFFVFSAVALSSLPACLALSDCLPYCLSLLNSPAILSFPTSTPSQPVCVPARHTALPSLSVRLSAAPSGAADE